MHKSKTLRVLGLAVLVCGLGSAIFAADPAPAPSLSQSSKMYAGIAKPFLDVTISYERPGRVLVMHVKDGELVKKDQVLAELNAEEEKWALKIDELKANSNLSIDAEKAVMEQKQADYDRMNDPRVRGATSATELNAAKLEVVVAKARIALAEQQKQEDGLKLKQDSAGLDKTILKSPMDGRVVKIFIHEGESAEGGKLEAMRIIQNDPLLVEVPVPVAQALKLKEDDVATVHFQPTPEGGKDVRQGKITNIAEIADIGSQLIMVKVQVANPQTSPLKSRSNLRVEVDFSSPDRVAQK